MKDTSSVTAYIGIGSNLGDKHANCLEAISRIDRIKGCKVDKRSSFYKTSPVGVENQDWYLNAVISILTVEDAFYLLEKLLTVESEMGRVRRKKWDSRPIDLDILIYGDYIIKTNNLVVPHPLMHLRKFVLVPMVQIVPDLCHPVSGKTMTDILESAPEDQEISLWCE